MDEEMKKELLEIKAKLEMQERRMAALIDTLSEEGVISRTELDNALESTEEKD